MKSILLLFLSLILPLVPFGHRAEAIFQKADFAESNLEKNTSNRSTSIKVTREGIHSYLWNAGDNITSGIAAGTSNEYKLYSANINTDSGNALPASQQVQVATFPEAYGAKGDGVTDDTTALTNFFNAAIANPGVVFQMPAKTYLIKAQLPEINVSNVIIQGAGAGRHDIGTNPTGTVILWGGASGGTMQVISPTSGSNNQHLTNIRITGISYNCLAVAAYGLKISSVWNSYFDVTVFDAMSVGLSLGVVSTLGEATDFQANTVHYVGKQYYAPNGYSLMLTGSAGGNVSINDFYITIQYTNVAGIYMSGSDNNNWHFVDLFRMPGGTAKESVSVMGGNTPSTRVRSERFYYFVATNPLHAYGTSGASPKSTYGAVNIMIYNLDKENGTPLPIVEPGASVYWAKDSTPFGDTPWVTTFTPTITPYSGSLTKATASIRYLQRGKICYIQAIINITTNGSASGSLILSLPFINNSPIGAAIIAGKELSTSKSLMADIPIGTSNLIITNYDGSYPGGNDKALAISGFYEID